MRSTRICQLGRTKYLWDKGRPRSFKDDCKRGIVGFYLVRGSEACLGEHWEVVNVRAGEVR